MVFLNTRIGNTDDKVKPFGNVSEVIFESADSEIERGGGKPSDLSKFDEESFDLMNGAVFGELV